MFCTTVSMYTSFLEAITLGYKWRTGAAPYHLVAERLLYLMVHVSKTPGNENLSVPTYGMLSYSKSNEEKWHQFYHFAL